MVPSGRFLASSRTLVTHLLTDLLMLRLRRLGGMRLGTVAAGPWLRSWSLGGISPGSNSMRSHSLLGWAPLDDPECPDLCPPVFFKHFGLKNPLLER